ncbi:MAG: DUF3710 domain-containing protein [Promicromonosporaceae bacterium]|nr:DUF3710 domain-containing protein [Promicromonosporaceae bacterium]
MPLFRKKTQPVATPVASPGGAPVSAPTPNVSAAAPSSSVPSNVTPAVTAPDGTAGPKDSSVEPELGARLDLGTLRVPVIPGMQVRMEMDRATQQVTGVSLMQEKDGETSSLQLQAFAAPRKQGIWDEIREELVESIKAAGGTVDDVPGPFGRELIARIITGRAADGPGSVKAARFVGFDGPRWFVRGVFTGPAATDHDAAAQLEDLFRNTVVVRDSNAMPPRDLLPLTLPGQPKPGEEPEADTKPTLDPFKRGPEITEIH